MSILLAQISPKIGDIQTNKQLMLDVIQGSLSDIIVFPECCLTGYPPTDLLMNQQFAVDVNNAIDDILDQTKAQSSLIIFGSVIIENQRRYNSALCICNGELIHRYDKQLLPNYDIFNESRYFEPGKQDPVCHWNGQAIGIQICEDIWVSESTNYLIDPAKSFEHEDLSFIVHMSASPFEFDKLANRTKHLKQLAKRSGAPIISVNQVGAYSDIIFDGTSQVIDKNGTCIHQLKSFEIDIATIDYPNNQTKANQIVTESKYENIRQAIQFGLTEYIHRSGLSSVVIGVSGGIDSALVAALAVSALGSNNVTLVSMPTQYNSSDTKQDAIQLAKNCGCDLINLPIEDLRISTTQLLDSSVNQPLNSITKQNIQARLRGLLLMAIANEKQSLLLTTGNKSELAMGYATLYGDMCGGLNIIGDLFKTDVFELSKHINKQKVIIPSSIITRPPSAELAPNQKDIDALPEYSTLDAILNRIMIKNESIEQLLLDFDAKTVRFIIKQLKATEFKRWQSPPILKVSSKSFGSGWQYPIVT